MTDFDFSQFNNGRITGRVGGTPEQPGRFGWKARVPDIETFVATAFAEELGLPRTTAGPRLPPFNMPATDSRTSPFSASADP